MINSKLESSCSHCHLTFPDEVMIHENDLRFCCNGCQSVYHLIHDRELDSYYSKIGEKKLAPPKQNLIDSSSFDSSAFYSQYVKKIDDNNNLYEIYLHIEGIHCSACVWLNEQILYETDGIIEAKINFSNHRAYIKFDKNQINLSKIVETIRSIGYDAKPFENSERGNNLDRERRDYYIRLAVGIFGVMNIMWISIALYRGYFTGIDQNVKTILNVAEWILSTPVLFYSGWIFFRGAYFGLKNKIINMDLLVASGSLLTYIFSIYITLTERGEAYFDSVAMIITFILIGKFLELLSKRSISQNLDLISKYQPSEIELIDGKKIDVQSVKIGDIVIVRTGERIGVDGEIVSGSGSIDESSLSGESLPVFREIKNHVLSGTLLIDGYLEIKVSREYRDSYISRIVAMLESAMNSKPNIENLANRISGWFSAGILILAFSTFIGWAIFTADFHVSFVVAVSVLIIACPCALALSTPIGTLVGLNMATREGILFKEGKHLETVAEINSIAFDKTGTLTIGKPTVSQIKIFKSFDEIEKKRLISLLNKSHHVIAESTIKYLNIENNNLFELENFQSFPARGVSGFINNIKISAGNYKFMQEQNINLPFESQTSHLYYSENNEIIALFEFRDEIRTEAKAVISKIKNMGIKIAILSGDEKNSVDRIADEVGISERFSGMTPEDKLKWIENEEKAGYRVMMVGDGVNDILALKRAEIGVAIGSGTDVAMSVSDIVLKQENLNSLSRALEIGRETLKLIRQNLGISLIYNSITIPLAMSGFIIPLFASISMSLSSLLVVLNSMRRK